jgi:hypothetical protein
MTSIGIDKFISFGRNKDVWLIRLLVQNGTIFYASWLFIVFLLNIEIILVAEFKISPDVCILIVLVLFSVKLLVYFVIENFLAYKYSKFLFANWLLYFVFLIGSLINLKDIKDNYHLFVFELAVLGLTFILFVYKLVKFIYNEFFLYKSFQNFF